MGTVSTNKGDFVFQSVDDVIKFVQAAAQEKGGIWISGEEWKSDVNAIIALSECAASIPGFLAFRMSV